MPLDLAGRGVGVPSPYAAPEKLLLILRVFSASLARRSGDGPVTFLPFAGKVSTEITFLFPPPFLHSNQRVVPR